MNQQIRLSLMTCFLFILIAFSSLSAKENFILINGLTDEKIIELGSDIQERVTPGSTFKIALSLMGFDSGILKNEKNPVWLFQDGYDDFLESWKTSQTPQSWIKISCVWYSRILAKELGIDLFKFYLAGLNYGNQDVSGGLTNAWLSSSLQISAEEQVMFIQKMIQKNLPVSNYANEMTKKLLFIEELPEGWKLFGKTGWGLNNKPNDKSEIGWFVGWIEKDDQFFVFAYHITENKINFAQRIPRVKHLLTQSNIMLEK